MSPAATPPATARRPAGRPAMPAQRVRNAAQSARWAAAQLRHLRAVLGPQGLTAQVAPPPTTGRTSLFAARATLRARRASCLERSLVIQAWFAAAGVPLDVIIGVRNPQTTTGATAHAWVDRYDADCSATYAEIRRVSAPALPTS